MYKVMNMSFFDYQFICWPHLLNAKSFEDDLLDILRSQFIMLSFYLLLIYDLLFLSLLFLFSSSITLIFALITIFSLPIIWFEFRAQGFLAKTGVAFSLRMWVSFHIAYHMLKLSYRVNLLLSSKEFPFLRNQLWLV